MFKKLKLSAKLWGLTGLLLVAVLIVGLNSIRSINGILAATQKFAQATAHDVLIVHKEVDHLKWMNRVKDLFVDKPDRTHVQLDYTKCGIGKFIYGEEAKTIAAGNADLADLIEIIKAHHINLHQSAELMNSTVNDAGHEKTLEVYQQYILPALSQTQTAMKAVAGKLKEIKESTRAEMISTGTRSRWSTIVATAIALLAGGLLSALVIRSIIKLGQKTIAGVNEGAEQVSSASGQVSSSSQFVAEGAPKQAASIEDNAVMSAMTKQNADIAGQADDIMKDANQSNGASAEEAAGAAEGMTAQAEEMKSMVGDLVELIDGRGNDAVQAASTTGPVSQFRTLFTDVARLTSVARQASAPNAPKAHSPEQSIPRGDEDFNYV